MRAYPRVVHKVHGPFRALVADLGRRCAQHVCAVAAWRHRVPLVCRSVRPISVSERGVTTEGGSIGCGRGDGVTVDPGFGSPSSVEWFVSALGVQTPGTGAGWRLSSRRPPAQVVMIPCVRLASEPAVKLSRRALWILRLTVVDFGLAGKHLRLQLGQGSPKGAPEPLNPESCGDEVPAGVRSVAIPTHYLEEVEDHFARSVAEPGGVVRVQWTEVRRPATSNVRHGVGACPHGRPRLESGADHGSGTPPKNGMALSPKAPEGERGRSVVCRGISSPGQAAGRMATSR